MLLRLKHSAVQTCICQIWYREWDAPWFMQLPYKFLILKRLLKRVASPNMCPFLGKKKVWCHSTFQLNHMTSCSADAIKHQKSAYQELVYYPRVISTKPGAASKRLNIAYKSTRINPTVNPMALNKWSEIYPLVMSTVCYWKWSFIVSFPIKNGDVP